MNYKRYTYNTNFIPVCPDSGEKMVDITCEMSGVPANVEIWESPDSRSLFIRQGKYSQQGLSDYTSDELQDVRILAKSMII